PRRAPVGNGARGLLARRDELGLLPPRPRAEPRLSLGRGRSPRHHRPRGPAVLRPRALEREGPDPDARRGARALSPLLRGELAGRVSHRLGPSDRWARSRRTSLGVLRACSSRRRRPPPVCHGHDPRLRDDTWRDLVTFAEYFCGDSGRGIGARYQGWTTLAL